MAAAPIVLMLLGTLFRARRCLNPGRVGVLALAAMANLPLFGQAPPEWKIVSTESQVRFSIKHFFSPVRGTFTDFEGKILFAPEQLGRSSFAFSLGVASIDTDNRTRDANLQKRSYFYAEEYPRIRFVSTEVKEVGPGKYLLRGKLSIRGETRSVQFPIQIQPKASKPGGEEQGEWLLSLEYNLNRTDYGVGNSDWVAKASLDEEVSIEIDLTLRP